MSAEPVRIDHIPALVCLLRQQRHESTSRFSGLCKDIVESLLVPMVAREGRPIAALRNRQPPEYDPPMATIYENENCERCLKRIIYKPEAFGASMTCGQCRKHMLVCSSAAHYEVDGEACGFGYIYAFVGMVLLCRWCAADETGRPPEKSVIAYEVHKLQSAISTLMVLDTKVSMDQASKMIKTTCGHTPDELAAISSRRAVCDYNSCAPAKYERAIRVALVFMKYKMQMAQKDFMRNKFNNAR